MAVPNTSTIIFIRGLPGSGKSYVAKALLQKLGHTKAILLDPDATNYESPEYQAHVEQQNKEGVDPKLHPYRFLRAQAYKAIEEKKVAIWNQPFRDLEIFHKIVARMQEHAAAHSVNLSILVVEVEIDPAVAAKRVIERKQAGGHGPTENTFKRFINEHVSFAGNDFSVVAVHGEDDVSTSAQKIIDHI